MSGIFISVGSNIEPATNLLEALKLLHREAPLRGISTFYRTKPLNRPEQPPFYNGVVRVETALYMVLSAANNAPRPMITPTTVARNPIVRENCSLWALKCSRSRSTSTFNRGSALRVSATSISGPEGGLFSRSGSIAHPFSTITHSIRKGELAVPLANSPFT